MTTDSVTERNRQIIDAMYRAGMAGDLDGMFAYINDDVVIDEPAFLPYTGIYRGKDDLRGLWAKIFEFMDLTKITLHYMIADGDRVAACIGIPDTTTGRPTHFLEQSTLRDGKVVEMKLFYYDPGTMIEKARS
jgi:ketosteroid isomerase-like protein